MGCDHIIDILIAERAPGLAASPLWPLLRPALYALLGYDRARSMADAIDGVSGEAALAYVAQLLSLDVTTTGLEQVPQKGRIAVVCNHPTGIADGIAMYEALKARRPDLIFFANADAVRVSPRLGEVIIPVEWVEAKRTREKTRDTLAKAREAFESERCVVFFPAGRLARRVNGVLSDPLWQTGALSLARKYGAPVVPAHMTGPNSTLFHLFDRVSQELRDITLFHELLNKRGKPFGVLFSQAVPPTAIDTDAVAASAAMKAFVEKTLPAEPGAVFG